VSINLNINNKSRIIKWVQCVKEEYRWEGDGEGRRLR
jgi:hypothetical protein